VSTKLREGHCDGIAKNHRKLLSVFGTLKDVVLPDETAIEECVSGIFDKVAVEKKDIPFSLESASQSLDKVLKGIPPSGPKNQQFKDGVIWSDCIGLLAHDDVALITNDKAFFKGGEYKNGLATNLSNEAAEQPNNINIYESITDFIEEIQVPISIDKVALVSNFVSETQETIEKMLTNHGFIMSGDPDVNVTSYITENTDQLFIKFDIVFDCSDVTDAGRTQGLIKLSGDALYEPSEVRFSNFRNLGEELTFTDSEGEQQRKSVNIFVGSIVLGHKDIEHTVRHKI
jgi:hypothetical protein